MSCESNAFINCEDNSTHVLNITPLEYGARVAVVLITFVLILLSNIAILLVIIKSDTLNNVNGLLMVSILMVYQLMSYVPLIALQVMNLLINGIEYIA